MKKATFKKALSVVLALCMIVTLFAGVSLVPSSAAGTTPDLIRISGDSNANNRLQYTKGWSTIAAGNYRFEMDCIIYSGTPVIRVGTDESGVLASWQSNYVSTYDEANHKYIITFTVASDWEGNLGAMVGNYYNAEPADFACANPTLYLLDASGNPTGSSLINTFAESYYSTSRTGNKWNKKVVDKMTFTCPIPDGYFDVAEEVPPTSDLVEISGDTDANDRLQYTKGWSTIAAGNYRFEMDCIIYSGTPVICVGKDETGELQSWQSNYVSTYDEANHKYIITFTVASDWSGNLGVRVGNYYQSDIAHIAVANPTLYLLDADGNPTGESLINTFASDYYSTSRTGDKWNRPTTANMTCSELPENYFAPTKPHLVEIPASAEFTRFQYTKSYTTIKAGNYRFEMDCKIFSGTPVIRVGNDVTGELSSWQSNYQSTYDEVNHKYIITFTVASDWSGNLGAMVGNYGQSDLAHFVFANPTLYLLDAEGNNTGKNLINTFASNYYSDGSRAADKWDRRAHQNATFTTPIPTGYFDKVATTGTPYMVTFPQGQTWKYVEYNDEYLTLVNGKTYVFTIDERDVTGAPTVTLYDTSNKNISTYASDFTDVKNGTTRTITFTMASTVSGIRICVGNYSDALDVSGKYANAKLVEAGSDTNLIAGFSSDTFASSAEIRKWRKAGLSNSGNIFTFYTSAIPDGYLENTLTDKMFYISDITTNASYGNTIVNTGAAVQAGKKYTAELDWSAHAGLDPAIRATYKNTAGSWVSLNFADFTGNMGHYTATFTMPDDAATTSIFNIQIGVGADIKEDNYTFYGRGSVYFGNFSLKAEDSDVNILTNADLKFANEGDFTKTIAWNIGVSKNNGSRDLYGDLKVLEQPENFFTEAGAPAKKMVTIDGGDYDYLRQSLVLESNTKYRLTYKALFVNAETSAYIQVVDSSNNYTSPTYEHSNYDANTRTKTIEFTTLSDMREAYQNTILQFYIGRDGSDVKLSIADVKLYKLDANENTVGGNLINNGGLFFGDGVILEEFEKTEENTSIKPDAVELLGWYLYANFRQNNSIEVTDITANSFPAADPKFTDQMGVITKYLLSISNQYFDANNDSKEDVRDLVAAKELASDVIGAEDEAAAWKAQYLTDSNATDPTLYEGKTVYYVDATNGSDSNNGKTPETAWESLSKAGSVSGSNVAVLFKCGNVWRSDISSSWGTVDDVFTAQSGVFYGSYGEGAKPVISGSAKNYGGTANQSNWTQVSGMENVWRYNLGSTADAGIVVYNNGELIGSMTKTKDDVATANIGDFCHLYQVVDNVKSSATNSSYIYVKSDENPALKWDSIEIGVGRHVVAMEGNTTFDNIAVMYTGKHGFSGSDVNNVTIQNCYVSYIGGSFQDSRLGNGIQFGQGGSNHKVLNTYVNECFDAGITFQTWSGSGSWSNLEFTNNLVENCHYSFEWFGVTGTGFTDILIDNNIFKGAGYGWSYDERVGFGEDMGVLQVSHFRAGSNNAYYEDMTNFQFTNNILDSSKRSLVYWWWNDSSVADADIVKLTDGMFKASGNSFYQRSGCEDYITQYISETRIGGCSSSKVLEALKKFENTNAPTGSARFIYDEQNVIIK